MGHTDVSGFRQNGVASFFPFSLFSVFSFFSVFSLFSFPFFSYLLSVFFCVLPFSSVFFCFLPSSFRLIFKENGGRHRSRDPICETPNSFGFSFQVAPVTFSCCGEVQNQSEQVGANLILRPILQFPNVAILNAFGCRKAQREVPELSGHYLLDWSEYVNVIGAIREPFAREFR